jgi:hypothetical protein
MESIFRFGKFICSRPWGSLSREEIAVTSLRTAILSEA